KEAHILLSSLDKLEAGSLRLAASSSLASFPLMAAFQDKYPGITLSFTATALQQLKTGLFSFQSDIMIDDIPAEDDRLFCEKLGTAPLRLAVSKRHPLADREAISPKELNGSKLILPCDKETLLLRPKHWSHKLDHEERRILQLGNKELAREAVAYNLGVSFLTEAEARDDPRICLLELDGVELMEESYLVCLAELRESRLISAFFDCAFASG
ncbi:MAG: hypothetical protein EP348_03895, partial [Alphaproteobacteria bacterium]